MRRLLPAVVLLVLAPATAAADQITQFDSFRRAASLGLEPLLVHVFADDSVTARIDSLAPSEVLRFDTDGDGVIDALAWREGTIRVAALDEDHDLKSADSRPDRDNDCYLADLEPDGVLDRAVDYLDLDGDGDADRQDLYEISPGSLGVQGLGITSVMDLDDDNRFLALTDYGYHANRDQWRSDFDGNTCLVAGERDESTGRWVSGMENPFCFYDDDGDGLTDEALRLEGTDLLIRSMRWSFDADGDADPQNPRDYDFSLTATGEVRAPAAFADSIVLRDHRAIHFVSWNWAREFVRWGFWNSALLVWDETDQNTAPSSEDPDRERWEGVIAEAYAGMPQIGGPATGRINKRYEIDRDASGRLGLYWTDVDDRVHLFGAEQGDFQILIPASPPIRREVKMADADGNGFFDAWTYSAQSLVIGERKVEIKDEAPRLVPLDGTAIRTLWRRLLPAARNRSRWELEPFEEGRSLAERSPIRRWWLAGRDRNDPLVVRAQGSMETERFLYDVSLWEVGGGFLARGPEPGKPGARWRIDCPAEPSPSTLAGPSLLIDPGGLDPDKRKELLPLCLVELERGGNRVSGQVEDWDADLIADLLYFPGAPPDTASGRGMLTIEIDPPHPVMRGETVRVDPFFATGIAFESEPIAFWTYDGRLDLFIKRRSGGLILRRKIGDYHVSQPWGMDALEIGSGPGLGGLFAAGQAGEWQPLFGSGIVREQRVIAPGPKRTVVRVVLAAGDVTATRTWILDGGDRAILEMLQVDLPAGTDSTQMAVALQPLQESGRLAALSGLWTFGDSAPGAGAIGLAGALLDGRPAEAIPLAGTTALRFTLRASEQATLGWVAGGEAYGESSAERWAKQAADLLKARKNRNVTCHPS